jgi:mannose-6-phosphate isomerase-like protein (cupin superfamily)
MSALPVHVPPEGGDTVFLVGDTYTTLLSGAQTGGAFTLLEALVPAHTGPPPHIHHAEDETFILLEGALSFRVADATYDARAGTVIFGSLVMNVGEVRVGGVGRRVRG